MAPSVRILGTRGIPAAHGGFETFAEQLALYLCSRGWHVTVYCQENGDGAIREDSWRGVRRVHIPVRGDGPRAALKFDWRALRHAARAGELCLTLGYNTALFCALLRRRGVPNLINMDGIEWARAKWPLPIKAWFYLNDWAGCWLGNHLIADHPEIAALLSTRVRAAKITTIPYGADRIDNADQAALSAYGLRAGDYAVLIARAEPENSVLEVVRAWSRRPRNCQLVVLGHYDPTHTYQRAVRAAAGPEVVFAGAIYAKATVNALRFFARFYVHGHRVGGTNPSLVEALGAGSAVLAHDNRFNRWVAADAGVYFSDELSCAQQLECLLKDTGLLARLRAASRARHAAQFTWDGVLADYERLLAAWLPSAAERRATPVLKETKNNG
jgi:glycosyltransferase involved in cell wall biosynthesis